MGLHCKSTAVACICSWVLLFNSNVQAGEPYPPVPGSYRPTGESPRQHSSRNNQQFVPSRNSNPQPSYQDSLPPAPGYSPPSAPYGDSRYNPPGYGFNPGMYGGGTQDMLPYGYPAAPLSGTVAPVYDPPLPATTPGWGSGYAPPASVPGYPQQPATQPYWQQQPATPQTGEYLGTASASQPQDSFQTAPPSQPAPAAQAPRPFSNPQETGSAFVQRSPPSLGRTDKRFRPPELKGTP